MSRSTLKRGFTPFLLIGVMALAIAGPVPVAGADHHGKTKHRFVETARSAIVWSSPDWPFTVGSTAISAVLVKGHRTDVSTGEVHPIRDVQWLRNVITDVSPPSLKIKTYGVVYFGDGTVRKVQHWTATLQPDGSVLGIGKGTTFGGTGSRKGIRGHFHFTGHGASPTSPWVFHVEGVNWF